ncbi:hypothetical protein, partial [Corynebacterium sp.]|uniref:hypothetical protein n=1 Tax=Corynebacterium sp. TaxID=1720 RepID=UPI0026DCBD3E
RFAVRGCGAIPAVVAHEFSLNIVGVGVGWECLAYLPGHYSTYKKNSPGRSDAGGAAETAN